MDAVLRRWDICGEDWCVVGVMSACDIVRGEVAFDCGFHAMLQRTTRRTWVN